MYSWDNPADRVAIVQMNSELQNAQLELLSAHCATHQLRLRFSTEDLARFGQRDVLRKSLQAATALSEYYTSIDKKIAGVDVDPEPKPVTEEQIRAAVERVAAYLRGHRERYFPSATPVPGRMKALMRPYFAATLLDRVRIVDLAGSRLPNPPFYGEYKALGFANLPEIAHMHSLTFLDVIVFNEKVTERTLFHGLVHAVQFEVLGLAHYTDLFVRSFVNTRLHYNVPLEAHVFSLESKFASAPAQRFSVEEQVRLWVQQARY
jgi:hypothetical protein